MACDRGQMLLLTSVILLIGFIALSSMVIRVTQLPEETTQESRDPIELEADAVSEGVGDLLARMHTQVPIDPVLGAADYSTAVEESLNTLVHLEKGRGFRFEWIPNGIGDAVTCTAGLNPGEVVVTVTVVLQDLDTRIQLSISETFGDGVDPLVCTP